MRLVLHMVQIRCTQSTPLCDITQTQMHKLLLQANREHMHSCLAWTPQQVFRISSHMSASGNFVSGCSLTREKPITALLKGPFRLWHACHNHPQLPSLRMHHGSVQHNLITNHLYALQDVLQYVCHCLRQHTTCTSMHTSPL